MEKKKSIGKLSNDYLNALSEMNKVLDIEEQGEKELACLEIVEKICGVKTEISNKLWNIKNFIDHCESVIENAQYTKKQYDNVISSHKGIIYRLKQYLISLIRSIENETGKAEIRGENGLCFSVQKTGSKTAFEVVSNKKLPPDFCEFGINIFCEFYDDKERIKKILDDNNIGYTISIMPKENKIKSHFSTEQTSIDGVIRIPQNDSLRIRIKGE